MEVNEAFVSAVHHERRGRWKQAARKYEEILTLLQEKTIKDNIDTNSLRMLLYECHLHCGVAYHHLDQKTAAITHYTSAMRVISRKKISCFAGCISGRVLHFHVPALAKIATCHLQQGEYKNALKKVEEALVLDFKNPDLFCIRACSYYLLDNKNAAMKDVNFAIWLRPKHVCAWLLRGIFKEKQKEESGQKTSRNIDIEMACSLDASTLAFTVIKNLPSSVHDIFNRYLPSLRVSHTISPSEFFREGTNESTQCQHCKVSNKSSASFREYGCESEKKWQGKKEKACRKTKEKPFICGMASSSFHRCPTFATSIQRKGIIQDSNLSTKTRFEHAVHNISNFYFNTTSTQRSLPREQSVEVNFTNTSFKELKRKIIFPSGGIKAKDLLDVKVQPEQQGTKLRSTDKCLRRLGSVTSYPVASERPVSIPCRALKVRLRQEQEQERLYARMWTQNHYPVRIPDITRCRSLEDFQSIERKVK